MKEKILKEAIQFVEIGKDRIGQIKVKDLGEHNVQLVGIATNLLEKALNILKIID